MRQGPISYFADMVASPLLATGMASFALTHFGRFAILEWSVSVAIGGVLWTLIEYIMHRVIYHRVPFFEKYHQVHHTDPRAYVGAPPMVATGAVFLVSFVPLACVSPLLANAASVGMLIGYTIYMVVHHACHFRMPMQPGYFYRLRLHHVVHHYSRDSGNFGVTTSFWDHVFGTRIKPASHHSRST
jgi:sterol desaturase/sphingolipid hydroxylase (fatty acid hydroxylase superfamily)